MNKDVKHGFFLKVYNVIQLKYPLLFFKMIFPEERGGVPMRLATVLYHAESLHYMFHIMHSTGMRPTLLSENLFQSQ